MVSKAAYVRPIKDLSVVAGRVSEQVCGRVVHHFTETFKKGSSKTVAVIVDGDSLRSVLVLEAWAFADQAHMKQTLFQYAGQVVSLTNFKLQSKGRSLVYFDRDLKMAFDKNTKVDLGTGEFPVTLPLFPNVKDATLCNGPCMVSMQVVLLEDPVTSEAKMQAGGTKKVCNAKVASGDCSLNVAFWHPLSEDMASASKNGVFRLDWMMLIPDGPGKFKLTSGSGSAVQQQIGDVAEETRQKLAVVDGIQSLSASYGRSREEKLKQMFSVGSLTTLHHIMHLDPATGVYQGRSMMIPAVFVKDIRGMNSDNSESLWYLGCTHCKKQLHEDKGSLMCETHGANAGKRVYGAQVLFADPTRMLEVAVWEDALRALAVSMVDASFDMDEPEETQKLLATAMTQKMCVRVEFGVNKAGTGMYYDLFDISAQVTEDGVCGAFKALTEDVFFGNPGIVPACCKNIKMNERDQLQVNVAAGNGWTWDSIAMRLQRLRNSHHSCGSWSSNVSAGVHDGAAEEVAERSLPEALGKWHVSSCTVHGGGRWQKAGDAAEVVQIWKPAGSVQSDCRHWDARDQRQDWWHWEFICAATTSQAAQDFQDSRRSRTVSVMVSCNGCMHLWI